MICSPTILALITILTLLIPQQKGVFDPFTPGKADNGVLHIENGVAVLELKGTPEEMGRAHGALLAKEGAALVRFYLTPAATMSGGVETLKKRAKQMDPFIPERFKAEMKALADVSSKDYETVLAGVAFPDVYRGGGCSTFSVSGSATKQGAPLMARNLDFFTMGVLEKYSMVYLFQPRGYYSFISVNWPILIGVLSGMNEKGLCCAVMEVRSGKREYKGMPSVLLFRRLMEEAATVEEAVKILKETKKVASNNLMLMDASGNSVVAEIGPKKCNLRKQENGIVFSTNHHQFGKSGLPGCRRFKTFSKLTKEHHGDFDLELLKQALHKVNQGMISVQSMIFEPKTLNLHLSSGKLPATTGEYKLLSFKDRLIGAAKVVKKTK